MVFLSFRGFYSSKFWGRLMRNRAKITLVIALIENLEDLCSAQRPYGTKYSVLFLTNSISKPLSPPGR